MTLIQFANAFAIAITFASWRRSSEATAVPYGANLLLLLLLLSLRRKTKIKLFHGITEAPVRQIALIGLLG